MFHTGGIPADPAAPRLLLPESCGHSVGQCQPPPHSIRCVGHDHNTWEGTAISSTCLLLSGLNRLCYIFLSVMLFGRMYSDELSQVFMKEQEGKKKLLLLAAVLKALLSVIMPGDCKGLKQGAQCSAQPSLD